MAARRQSWTGYSESAPRSASGLKCKKLQREHAEAKHERMMKLERQRHINRTEKQQFFHDQAKELVLLRRKSDRAQDYRMTDCARTILPSR
jgi:hypothetical protein